MFAAELDAREPAARRRIALRWGGRKGRNREFARHASKAPAWLENCGEFTCVMPLPCGEHHHNVRSALGRRQVVRQRFLVSSFAGSNPAAPAMTSKKFIPSNGIAASQAAVLPSARRSGSQTGSHAPARRRRDSGRRWGLHLIRRNSFFCPCRCKPKSSPTR